ncbi:MAG: hypothetical protein Q7R87_02140 [Nanoarchaeota archaeon]|nr:hypothetical protein [Nanoarchaeota archaeon]
MLLCGKPESVDTRRWFIKCLSNDQTAFTGFTSLVDIVESNTTGYDGRIKLLPSASFVEPFALDTLDNNGRKNLLNIKDKLDVLDSTKVQEINELLREAELLCPININRKKGKSPIFFYGVSDKPFQLPKSMYNRLERAARTAYNSLCSATGEKGRQVFTGSVDFMISGEDIYLIDIGAPAVGYVADILATSKVLGRKSEIGIEKLLSTTNKPLTIARSTLSKELGFFKLEKEYIISELKNRGIEVKEISDESNEVIIDGKSLPSQSFDFIARNQPVRNKVLASVNDELLNNGIKIPMGKILQPDDFTLARFYEESKIGNEEFGLLIKKKVLFKEYETGSGYFKPLVTPVWSRELRADNRKSNLFEQFIPSLIETDIAGDKVGKRCYEIRMYFTAGESR